MTKLPKLPADYKKFLKTHDGETEYIFDDIDGWRFYTTEELTEVIRIDREKVMNKDLNRFERGILKNINKYGWMAERKSPKQKWKRIQHHPFPSFDEDGYYLEDAVELAEQRDDLTVQAKTRELQSRRQRQVALPLCEGRCATQG